MSSKALLRASAAAVVLSLGMGVGAQESIPANQSCPYRIGRPVWHFIPAKQVADDVKRAMRRANDYAILRESGGVVSQKDYFRGLAADFDDAIFITTVLAQFKKNSPEPLNADDQMQTSETPTITTACKAAIENDDATDADGLTLSDAITFLEGQNISRDDIFEAIVEGGLSDHLTACHMAGRKRAPSKDEIIQRLADDLLNFRQESNSPGTDPSAPIPYGSPLNPGWHYVRVTMVQSNLAYDRRFWRKYFPALYTELQFDSFGADRKAVGISAEDGHYKHDRNRIRRTLVMNQVVLPPTPYIDGELRAEISILAVESYDYGRAFMSFLSNVTNGISSKLLSQAEDVFKILDEGIKQLAGTDAEKQFLEAGVAIDWPRPRTGYWLLLWPNKDFLKAYGKVGNTSCASSETPKATRAPFATIVQNRPGGKQSFSVNDLFHIAKTGPSEVVLLAKRGKIYERFDNATWSLIRVDALSTNPNWQRIPGLLDAQQRILGRMLQFYLPDFKKSGSYLDLQSTMSAEEIAALNVEGAVAAANEMKKEGKKEKLAAVQRQREEQKTAKTKEKFFQEELTKDFQFYYGLLMSSPDLLSTDKYKIIKREQLKFQRHLHVLTTTELREKLVAEGYRRWRKQVQREACSKLATAFPDIKPKDEPSQVCPDPDGSAEPDPGEETDATGTDTGASGDPNAAGEADSADTTPTEKEVAGATEPAALSPGVTPGPPPGFGDQASSVEFSPQLAAIRVYYSAHSLTDTVDEFMAAHPREAILANYRGPESIDGAMIMRAADRPGGEPVKRQVAEYISDLLMESWINDPYGHVPDYDQP